MKTFLKISLIFFLLISGIFIFGVIFYIIKLSKRKELKKDINKLSRKIVELKNNLDVDNIEQLIIQKNSEMSKVVSPLKKISTPQKKNPKSIQKKSQRIPGRQTQILEFVKKSPEIKVSDIENSFKNVSTRTLRRDLNKLEELGFVKQIGRTRDSRYKFIG